MDNSINKEMAKCLEASKPEIEKTNMNLQWRHEIKNDIEGCPSISETDGKYLEVMLIQENNDSDLDGLFLNLGNWEKGINELTG